MCVWNLVIGLSQTKTADLAHTEYFYKCDQERLQTEPGKLEQ